MIFKTSSLPVCASSNLPTFVWPFAAITSPCNPPTPRTRPPASIRADRPRPRRYATVRDGAPRNSDTNSSHPTSQWPACPNPTPYQIFDQQRTAPYSKARFYELVKIYHPDRHRQTRGDALTDAARLERYRLVVAANEILSDPVRRRAYDLYGAGWGSIRSMDSSVYRHADHSWRNEPGNPSMNATWEDWEKWYGEREGTSARQKQQTVFMSNELFVVVLCMFVVVGSMGQARRASTTTMSIVEMREQRHEAINHDLAVRRSEQGHLNRHERVESFLRQREGWNFPSSSVSRHPERVVDR